MTHSFDRDVSVNPDNSGLDMAYLQSLLKRQAQQPPLYENIAIIGCGYVGCSLAEWWQQQGHFVTGTTTSHGRVAELNPFVSRVNVVKGEDADAVTSLVQGQDTVVVSVAPTGFRAVGPDQYAATYLTTAQNVANALSRSPSVKQVIYLSSCSVYGDRQGDWVDETSATEPTDQRGEILKEAEKIMLQASTEAQRVCVFRLGGIYGPGREIVRMFGSLAGTTMPGQGDRVINWTHRDEIVSAVEFARVNQLQGIYNLVDDTKLTVRQQIDAVCHRYGLSKVTWDASQLGLRRASLRISNQKLKDAGYTLTHPELIV